MILKIEALASLRAGYRLRRNIAAAAPISQPEITRMVVAVINGLAIRMSTVMIDPIDTPTAKLESNTR